jgi:hypothetical protein
MEPSHILAEFQQQIKVKKGQYNSFGKYYYRSAEDILEAVKAVVNPLGWAIMLEDEIIEVGGRIYVKSTAILTNGEQTYSTSAMAREDETIKGMHASQITGSTSSYSRKYALNALFALEDTKDSDATNNHGKEATNIPEDKYKDWKDALITITNKEGLRLFYNNNSEAIINDSEIRKLLIDRKAQLGIK